MCEHNAALCLPSFALLIAYVDILPQIHSNSDMEIEVLRKLQGLSTAGADASLPIRSTGSFFYFFPLHSFFPLRPNRFFLKNGIFAAAASSWLSFCTARRVSSS